MTVPNATGPACGQRPVQCESPAARSTKRLRRTSPRPKHSLAPWSSRQTAGRSPIRSPAKSSPRLEFLNQVGLGYLTLDRPAETLSGGELQRVRLASGLGSGLVGTCYVLDEPSIGLHPRDNDRLIAALESLQRPRQFGDRRRARRGDHSPRRLADRPRSRRRSARRAGRGRRDAGGSGRQSGLAHRPLSVRRGADRHPGNAATSRRPAPSPSKARRRTTSSMSPPDFRFQRWSA